MGVFGTFWLVRGIGHVGNALWDYMLPWSLPEFLLFLDAVV